MTTYPDMMEMCRLCLVKDQVNLPIFGGQGDVQQIFLKITACLPVKVSREDNLPKNICDGCSYKLDLLYQFWNTSSNSEKQLIDWLAAAGVDPKQQSNEPIGLASQPHVILKQEPVTELDAISSDAQSYIMQQQQLAYKPEEYEDLQQNMATSTKQKASDSLNEESAAKRPRRATRNTKSVKEDDDSDEEYLDSTEAGFAKTEDESEDDDEDEDGDGDDGDDGDDMADPDFVDVKEDSEQPGPSGVSGTKTSTPGPSSTLDLYSYYKTKYGLKECIVFLGKPNDIISTNYRFRNEEAVAKVNSKRDRYKYNCNYCSARFRDSFKLDMHIEDEHPGVDTTESSSSSDDLYEPEQDEDEEEDERITRKTRLSVCEKKLSEKTKLVDDSVIGNTLQKIMKCPKCLKIFNSEKELSEHLKSEHNVFACMLCFQFFYSKCNFDSHVRNVHRNTAAKWRCRLCSISFTEYYHLIEHNFAKHKPNCTICGKDFPELQSLILHKVQRHYMTDKLFCKECGLEHSDEKSLDEHMKQHCDVSHCEFCGERIYSDTSYLEHLKDKHSNRDELPKILNSTNLLPNQKQHIETEESSETSSKLNMPPAYTYGKSKERKVIVPNILRKNCGTPPIQSFTTGPVTTQPKINPIMQPAKSISNNPQVTAPTRMRKQILPASTITIPVTATEQPKFLYVKNSNETFLIPAIMLQENQMKLTIPQGTVGVPLVSPSTSTMAGNFIQPNIMQTARNVVPTPPQINIRPSITNIQPTVTNIVSNNTMLNQRNNQMVQPTFVMSVPSNSNVIPNNVAMQIASNSPGSSSSHNPQTKTITIKKTKQLKTTTMKTIALNAKLRKIVPHPTTINSQTIPKLVISDVRTEIDTSSVKIIDDLPKLEFETENSGVDRVQSLSSISPSEQSKDEIIEVESPPPVLISEVSDSNAHKPKIFLKPLSQLLEKNKLVDTTPKASTSKVVLTKISADKVPEVIKKATANQEPAAGTNVKSSTDETKKIILNYNKNLNCSTCGQSFKSIQKLQQHMVKLKCKLCNYTGCRLKSLDVHYKVIHDYQNQCVTCELKFDSSEALRNHNKKEHWCMNCNKLYPSLAKHTSANVCIKCDLPLCSLKALTVHYLTAHKIRFFCMRCKKVFANESSMIAHKKELHYCDKCNSFKVDLDAHKAMCNTNGTCSVSEESDIGDKNITT